MFNSLTQGAAGLLICAAPLVGQPPPWAEKVIQQSQKEVVWHWATKAKAQRILLLTLHVDDKPIKQFTIPIRRDIRGDGISNTPIGDDKFEFELDHSHAREVYGYLYGNIWEAASMPDGLFIGTMAFQRQEPGPHPRIINERMVIPVNRSISIDLGNGVKMVSKIKKLK